MNRTPYHMGRGITLSLVFIAIVGVAVWLLCTWVESSSAYHKGVERSDEQQEVTCGQMTKLGPYRGVCNDGIVRHPIWAVLGIGYVALIFKLLMARDEGERK